MKGTIISINKVPMCDGSNHFIQTVIYERDGQRYRGATYTSTPKDGDSFENYYFGGGLKMFSDIDEAWEMAYSK